VRKILAGLAGAAILALLIWTGALWVILGAILSSIPAWAYFASGLGLVALTAFVKWAWSQNEIYPIVPGKEVVDSGED